MRQLHACVSSFKKRRLPKFGPTFFVHSHGFASSQKSNTLDCLTTNCAWSVNCIVYLVMFVGDNWKNLF